MEPLSPTASLIAVIQLTGSLVKLCWSYIREVENARDEIRTLHWTILGLQGTLQDLQKLLQNNNGKALPTSSQLVSNITYCLSDLQALQVRLGPGKGKKLMSKWGLRALKWPLKRTEVEGVIQNLERHKSSFLLSLGVDQMRSTNLIDRKIDIGRLKIAEGAAFDSYDNNHDECLPGTRVELLQQVEEWAKLPHEKCIFWLKGKAGTGKSTISRTVASRLKKQQLLGASFFFKRGEEDRGTAKRLFTTLIGQLVTGIPQMIPRVQRAIDDDPNISEKVLEEQFEKLLFDPLLGIEQIEGTMTRVIVIDALDECDSEDDKDISGILQLLPRVQKLTSVQLRFLLTSRPELPIRLGFTEITDAHQDLVLEDTTGPVIERDIKLYFEDQFSCLRQERSFASDWPGNKAAKILIERAVPLFIAAATLCRFIRDPMWNNPKRQLEAILKDQSTYVSDMGKTYVPILKQLLTCADEDKSQQLFQDFKEIVGAVIILNTPLSINALSQLLDRDQEDVKCRLDLLHSVLSIPDNFNTPVRLFHSSFRDFLLCQKGENQFWVNEKDVNQHLTAQCLQTMQCHLKRNICNRPSEGMQHNELDRFPVGRYIPPEVQYSCRYWAQHLVQSQDPVTELIKAFSFLKEHFLHWLEAMSILGYMSEVIGAIKKLESLIQGNKYSEISLFLYDARRFILKNRQIVDSAPLQLYSSGLIFAPNNSTIKRQFQNELAAWGQLPQVEENWSMELQTLEGHSGCVKSVAFSHDGQLLASGSYDKTIKLWDPTTGELRRTLKNHSYPVSISFSHCGKFLASGFDNDSIILWDLITGEKKQTLEKYYDQWGPVIFSPHSALLAFSSHGDNGYGIKLWNVITHERESLEGHHHKPVTSISFSPDGKLLASCSHPGIVILWGLNGLNKFEIQQKLKINPPHLSCLALSSSYLLVSSEMGGPIQLWDTTKGKLHDTDKRHFGKGRIMAVSQSGCLMASSCNDDNDDYDGCDDYKTIKLWNTTNSEEPRVIKGHSNAVCSIAFSPDGQTLASGSQDKTIRLWDLTTPTCGLQKSSKSRSAEVCSIAFSPDGRLLASGSYDGTFKLWNAKTGKVEKSLEDHCRSVAFSPDGQTLASGSSDGTINLWDLNNDTSTPKRNLRSHSNSVNSIVFSPDGQILASGSYDDTVKLWNVSTGRLQMTHNCCFAWVLSVAFSPKGYQLASCSIDGTVNIYYHSTLWVKRRFEWCTGENDWVRSVSFSSNGNRLACSSDEATKIWDVSMRKPPHCKRKPPRTLKGHSHMVWSETNRVSVFEKAWICVDLKKVLWLPWEYRPACLAMRDGKLALGHESGMVSFISKAIKES